MTCKQCDDGEGGCVFPYYGVAPHTHAPGPFIGSTVLAPRAEWPANFEPDSDGSGCGTWTHCLQCGSP